MEKHALCIQSYSRCKLIMFAQLNLHISFRKEWQRRDFLFQEAQI